MLRESTLPRLRSTNKRGQHVVSSSDHCNKSSYKTSLQMPSFCSNVFQFGLSSSAVFAVSRSINAQKRQIIEPSKKRSDPGENNKK
jgi:hypothetical protein